MTPGVPSAKIWKVYYIIDIYPVLHYIMRQKLPLKGEVFRQPLLAYERGIQGEKWSHKL